MGAPAYPTDQAIRAAILARARRYTRLTGVSSADIGKRALNDTAFLYQVEEGRNFTIHTYRKFMDWLDQRWPRDRVPPAGERSTKPTKPKKANGKHPSKRKKRA